MPPFLDSQCRPPVSRRGAIPNYARHAIRPHAELILSGLTTPCEIVGRNQGCTNRMLKTTGQV